MYNNIRNLFVAYFLICMLGVVMTITNEKLFFEHIARVIDKLTNAYSFALSEIEKDGKLVSAAIEYDLLLKRLNRAIDIFKTEMKACLKDYVHMKTLDMMREEYASRYIKNQLDELHKERDALMEHIPEEHLKTGLGHNYYFHVNLKKLTPQTLMDYFETNYTLMLEKDL